MNRRTRGILTSRLHDPGPAGRGLLHDPVRRHARSTTPPSRRLVREAHARSLLEHREHRHQRDQRRRDAGRGGPQRRGLRRDAQSEAHSVSGVVRVINNLQVKSPPRPDLLASSVFAEPAYGSGLFLPVVRRSNASARLAHPGRALLEGAPGAVRRDARGRAVVHPRQAARRRLLPRLRENAEALIHSQRLDRRGEPPDPLDLAGGRVAPEQFPHRRRADSRDPGRPATRVLPRAAQARLGRAPGLSPRLRAGLGVRRAHGQPDRARDARPVCPRLPARPAAHDRRALGAGHLAATGSRREPPAAGRGRVRARDRARPCGRGRGRATGHRRRPEAGAGRHDPDAGAAAVHDGVRGPARAEAPRAGPRGHTGARLARSPARPRGHDGRPGRPRRASGSGGHPCDGAQRDHQHAVALVGPVGRVLRERQSRSRGPLRGHPRRRDGLSHARPIPARRRGALARLRPRRGRGGATRGGNGSRRRSAPASPSGARQSPASRIQATT